MGAASVARAARPRRRDRRARGVARRRAAGRRARRTRDGCARRRAARARASALPPANEIAGFVVGAALLGLCVGGARLDGVIARAQARGMARDGDEARDATTSGAERSAGGGVFVVPDDDGTEDAG